jgi:hypothetical protein
MMLHALPQVSTPPLVSLLRAWVRAGIARFAGEDAGPAARALTGERDFEGLGQHIAQAAATPGAAEPAARLLARAQLEPAEQFLVALAGAVEEDHLVVCALAELQSPAAGARPTLHLAEALLAELFAEAWPAPRIAAGNACTRGVLSVLGDGPLPTRELAIDARLWGVLHGALPAWPGVRPLPPQSGSALPVGVRQALPSLALSFARRPTSTLILRGPPHSGHRRVAGVLAHALGQRALLVEAEVWREQPALALACAAAGWLPVIEPTLGPGETLRLTRAAEAQQRVVVCLGADGAIDSPDPIQMELGHPSADERTAWWRAALADERLGPSEPGLVEDIANAALLSGELIAEVAQRARQLAERGPDSTPVPLCTRHVAAARHQIGSDALRLLAHPVERSVPAAALVLPPGVQKELDAFIARCRARDRLWDGLGPTLAATTNRGCRALLVGESGTGKTLAVSYVATRLGAPLYRVDLAAVMNKYIGESEKNLGRVLDLAAAHDAVLLFDEADALFSQRSDAGETGERYVNLLTNFLLTRFEQHPGIVALTANSRARIDRAFVRRIDAIIEFSLPGPEERSKLWQSHLGERSPGEEACRYLAGWCDLAGGHIRNAVLNAAAQHGPGALPLPSLAAAAAAEYRKLGRPIPPALGNLG